jgi:hypothetical protein
MGRLKVPFFAIAVAAILLVVLVEVSAPAVLGRHLPGGLTGGAATLADAPAGAQVSQPPGRGIPYLALIDSVALFTVALMAVGLLLPDRIHARLQGVVTLVASIVLLVVSVVLLIAAVSLLITMVTLFFAVPFGTIAYLIVWGSFPRGQAAVLLSLLMFLKIVFVVMLVLAQPRFLQNKGLVALMATSMLANVVLVFLHGLVPVVLVSIVDDAGAVIFAVVAAVWGIVLLVGSVPAIIKAVRATP